MYTLAEFSFSGFLGTIWWTLLVAVIGLVAGEIIKPLSLLGKMVKRK